MKLHGMEATSLEFQATVMHSSAPCYRLFSRDISASFRSFISQGPALLRPARQQNKNKVLLCISATVERSPELAQIIIVTVAH